MLYQPPTHGDFERWRWAIPNKDLEGKITSFDELKKLFPKNGNISEIVKIKENDNWIRYGQKNILKGNLLFFRAYECKNCDELVIGSPRIEDDTDHGYKIYCRNCSSLLESYILREN